MADVRIVFKGKDQSMEMEMEAKGIGELEAFATLRAALKSIDIDVDTEVRDEQIAARYRQFTEDMAGDIGDDGEGEFCANISCPTCFAKYNIRQEEPFNKRPIECKNCRQLLYVAPPLLGSKVYKAHKPFIPKAQLIMNPVISGGYRTMADKEASDGNEDH